MDSFLLAFVAGMAVYMLISSEQRKRIALLGTHLSQFNIERLMETLADGYLRALGENDLARRDQIWGLLASSEEQLSEQFERFAKSFSKVDETQTRISKLALTLPLVTRFLPSFCFDARKAFAIHAQGFTRVARNEKGLSPRDKAFTMMAELLLMQHTCHWFCKSRAVASARLLARHQTAYEQVLTSVSPETRQAYLELTGRQ
ncbi:hypothetical protein [Ottowia thiooxydans]|uniref:hypothetical protein n=1 Tax=Ottowia thiooxydans TaxID=219182 RepID=UPI00048B2440|nr:hypothetical protein [Ottowia thiooxydans]